MKGRRDPNIDALVAAGRQHRRDEYVEALRNGTYARPWQVPSGKAYKRKARNGRKVEA